MTPAKRLVNLRLYEGHGTYIGRPGKGHAGPFGNPYTVNARCSRCGHWHATGRSTLPCYAAYLQERTRADPEFRKALLHLKELVVGGTPLKCFCAGKGGLDVDDHPWICHGQALLHWLDTMESAG